MNIVKSNACGLIYVDWMLAVIENSLYLVYTIYRVITYWQMKVKWLHIQPYSHAYHNFSYNALTNSIPLSQHSSFLFQFCEKHISDLSLLSNPFISSPNNLVFSYLPSNVIPFNYTSRDLPSSAVYHCLNAKGTRKYKCHAWQTYLIMVHLPPTLYELWV